jgi:hypothetical protein
MGQASQPARRPLQSGDVQVVYELVKDQFDRKLEAVDRMADTQNDFINIGTAMLAVIAALVAIKPAAFKGAGWSIVGLAAGAYGLMWIVKMLANRSQWLAGPNPQGLVDMLQRGSGTDTEIKLSVIAYLLDADAQNEKPYRRQAVWLQLASGLLIVLAIVVVGSAFGVALAG